ncbi:MAG: twin-arginine translocase TatA/TatE family subunit [Flavobacteriaceae bacterium]|nr:twin-arginine translocase TatA/TatE family subunit [Flavobacteriaceae bacterium]MAV13668.1 twin-arginine translocase TatA/TatE family subunit [Flavobacteriaceae bacterium]|tara:strand:- start:97 stop:363 length:267 start_codon:yes stop_codon:yes gene_type:complete
MLVYFISGAEIFVIFLIVLLLFGADKIPDIAKGLGKGIRQVKDATQEIKTEIKKSAKSKGVDTKSISDQIDKVKEDIDDITGSIKRDL